MTKNRKGGKTRRGGNRKRKGGFLAQFQKALAPYLLFQLNERQKKKKKGRKSRRGGSRKRRGGDIRSQMISKCQKQAQMGWKNKNAFGIFRSNMAPKDKKRCNLLLCEPGNKTPECRAFREREGQRGGSRKRRGGTRRKR